MNEAALRVLEYDKIIERLASFTVTEMSGDIAMALSPYADVHLIEDARDLTTEAVSLMLNKGPLPIGGFYDVRRQVSLTTKGGSLSMKELLDIARFLRVAGDIVSFMKGDDVPDIPRVRGMTDLIDPLRSIRDEIERSIISEDEMSDGASPKLRDIRRNIAKQNEAIRSKLSRLISGSETRTYLQDAIVTMRDGRYVVPVKQEHRNRVPGMIHDQSKGGQTLFIEPQAVVELNNGLRELELAEMQEIARILSELSLLVAGSADIIRNNQNLIVELDFIMAKGKLSRDMAAESFSIGSTLRLEKARHPLLPKDKAIPVDIRLGNGYRSLIVTGPNTGGKTVSLKTAGLLSLMAMSGLHIPAYETSEIPVFTEIFADIGDEQSIEQSLSTFSSHMRNIVGIIDKCDEDSLVLLDELGAGTDPTEGAALAIAILEKLESKDAMIMATTHYNELKKYALSKANVENASMEFNVETLSPTFKLIMGIPGKSNAFEISEKLGLGDAIIERASELIEGKDMEFEDVISSISEDRTKAESDREEARFLLAEAKAKAEYINEKERKLLENRENILNKAREEARDIIKEARDASKEIQKELERELKNLRRDGMSSGVEARIAEGRGRLKNLESKYSARTLKQVNSNPVSADDLKIGDRVKILSLNQNGEVLTRPDDKGDLMVLVGALKINVNIEDLMLINEGKDRKKPAPTGRVSTSFGKAMHVSASIDVRGENLEDAIMDVEKYIDDVYMAGLEQVTVIHGRGEGILKNGIRDMLKRNKLVASIKPGVYNEGGEGVTIVRIKK